MALLAGTSLSAAVAVTTPGAQAADTKPQIETIVVQGERYNVELPSLGKLTEPVIDTPTSISDVTRQLLDDRAVTNLNDALRNVPSITLGAGEFSWQGNNPTIRGFSARTDMFIDGMRDFGNYYRDPFNLDEIEVLEGPEGMIFGRGSTGGVINQVSKMPTLAPSMAGALTFGTDNTRRATIDVDQPLSPTSALRITAMGHDSNVADRDDVQFQRYGFAPSFSTGLGTATRATLSYYHQTENDIPDYGIPWFNGAPAPVARNNFYGFKSDYIKTDVDIVTAKVEHDFSDTLTLHTQARYANYGRDVRITEPLLTGVPVTTPLPNIMVTRNIFTGPAKEADAEFQSDLTAKFTTGIVAHDLVTGVEVARETSAPNFGTATGVPTVSLLSPDPNALFSATNVYNKLYADTVGVSFGLYALDTMKVGEHWEAIAGIRWDRFDANYHSISYSLPPAATGSVVGTNANRRIDAEPSYRAGLVYKPTAAGSIYFAYGTSFDPSAETLSFITSGRGLGVGNEFLAPEKNRSLEVGTKWQVLDHRLTLTGALFQTTKINARVPDPNPADAGFNILAGDQRARGIEVSASGRITDRWSINASYTYLNTDVIKSAPGAAPVGSRLPLAPDNAGSLWMTYLIGTSVEVGAGPTLVGNRLAQNTAPIETAPGYVTADAMVKYQITPHISVQANITNLTDKYYYDQLHPFHVVPGAGRTALFTANFKY